MKPKTGNTNHKFPSVDFQNFDHLFPELEIIFSDYLVRFIYCFIYFNNGRQNTRVENNIVQKCGTRNDRKFEKSIPLFEIQFFL